MNLHPIQGSSNSPGRFMLWKPEFFIIILLLLFFIYFLFYLIYLFFYFFIFYIFYFFIFLRRRPDKPLAIAYKKICPSTNVIVGVSRSFSAVGAD